MENLLGFYPNLQIDTPTSASQSFTSEDGVPNQRARVLGGGSAINAGFFTYATPDYVADQGWDGVLVNESYAWVADTVAQFPTLQAFQVRLPPLSHRTCSKLTDSRQLPAIITDQYHVQLLSTAL